MSGIAAEELPPSAPEEPEVLLAGASSNGGKVSKQALLAQRLKLLNAVQRIAHADVMNIIEAVGLEALVSTTALPHPRGLAWVRSQPPRAKTLGSSSHARPSATRAVPSKTRVVNPRQRGGGFFPRGRRGHEEALCTSLERPSRSVLAYTPRRTRDDERALAAAFNTHGMVGARAQSEAGGGSRGAASRLAGDREAFFARLAAPKRFYGGPVLEEGVLGCDDSDAAAVQAASQASVGRCPLSPPASFSKNSSLAAAAALLATRRSSDGAGGAEGGHAEVSPPPLLENRRAVTPSRGGRLRYANVDSAAFSDYGSATSSAGRLTAKKAASFTTAEDVFLGSQVPTAGRYSGSGSDDDKVNTVDSDQRGAGRRRGGGAQAISLAQRRVFAVRPVEPVTSPDAPVKSLGSPLHALPLLLSPEAGARVPEGDNASRHRLERSKGSRSSSSSNRSSASLDHAPRLRGTAGAGRCAPSAGSDLVAPTRRMLPPKTKPHGAEDIPRVPMDVIRHAAAMVSKCAQSDPHSPQISSWLLPQREMRPKTMPAGLQGRGVILSDGQDAAGRAADGAGADADRLPPRRSSRVDAAAAERHEAAFAVADRTAFLKQFSSAIDKMLADHQRILYEVAHPPDARGSAETVSPEDGTAGLVVHTVPSAAGDADDNDDDEEQALGMDELLVYVKLKQKLGQMDAAVEKIARSVQEEEQQQGEARRPDGAAFTAPVPSASPTPSGGMAPRDLPAEELTAAPSTGYPFSSSAQHSLSGRAPRRQGAMPEVVVRRLLSHQVMAHEYIAYSEKLWNNSRTSQFTFAQRLTDVLLDNCFDEVMDEVGHIMDDYVVGLAEHELQ